MWGHKFQWQGWIEATDSNRVLPLYFLSLYH